MLQTVFNVDTTYPPINVKPYPLPSGHMGISVQNYTPHCTSEDFVIIANLKVSAFT